MNSSLLKSNFELMIPNPKCELNYDSDLHLLIAILLSAQCTDKKVNSITPILFKKYPDLDSLKNASYNDIEKVIHPLGLSKIKAHNIICLANIISEKYNGCVPSNKKDLMSLPGIGNKSSNVMLVEYFKIPAFPVDTHIKRVSKRLSLANESDSLITIEKKLKKTFSKKDWASMHLRMVLFGRYICKSHKPCCSKCLFSSTCSYRNK